MIQSLKTLIFALASLILLVTIFYFLKNNLSQFLLAQISSFIEKGKLLEEEISSLKEKIGSVSENLKQEEKKIEELENDLKINKEFFGEQKEMFGKSKKEEKICQISEGAKPRHEVIFNEICWMGSEKSSKDEWIELKNISQQEIDLFGWQILNKDQKLKIFLEGKISPGEFFLLERGDDDSVPEVDANLIFSGAIKNKNEALYLFDKECNLQDIVEATPIWPAGESETKRTMERKEDFSWQTSENPGGTPAKENSKGLEIKEIKEIEKEKTGPKISLSYPSQIFSQTEFEVLLSISDLKEEIYDVKISILKVSDESEAKRTISEISLDGEEWQDSYKYLQKVFTGPSFSGYFKIRIFQEFEGEAEILVKIRDQNKKLISQYLEKIFVFKKSFSQSSLPSTSLPSQTEKIREIAGNGNTEKETTINVSVENLPKEMKENEVLALRIKINGIFGAQKFKIGLSAPGDEEYPPSYTSITSSEEGWQWSRNYFEIIGENGVWEGTVYLKLNPKSTRYKNIQDKLILSSRLSINGKVQDWNFHGEILLLR